MRFIDENVENYAIKQSSLPGRAARELAAFTRENEPMSRMLVGEMESSFLGFLVRSVKAKKVLEIGTFTGYSALAMAEGMGSGGEVHTIDIEPKSYTSSYWQKSGHGEKIIAHTGEAREIIPTLQDQFDLIFIDADKVGYETYLEMGLEKLAPGGIIVADNVLWSGHVLKSDDEIDSDDHSTRALKKFNEVVSGRSDLYGTLLPIRDGIFLIIKND